MQPARHASHNSVVPLAQAPQRGPRAPVVIAIMDGVGVGPADGGDAVHLARTPHLDALWQLPSTRSLRAHGRAVGLPSDDDMGNSEVGHNALGAGRVVRQGAGLVSDAIADGSLFRSATWRWLVAGPSSQPGAARPATLHLCGLLSDGNVHAHIDHVLAMVRAAAGDRVRRLRVHALADGRDVADRSYETYLTILDAALAEACARGVDARIASGGGRMTVTMDRYEADWAVVERGWAAHVDGVAPAFADWRDALRCLREREGGASDQTLGPFVIADDAGPVGRVEDGDSFVLWNFRGDRAIQLCKAFEDDDLRGFVRRRRPAVRFAGMMQYDGDLALPRHFLVRAPVIEGTMGEYAVASGLRTLAVSETQKYGHVTYFWNGNRSGLLDPALEQYVEIPSDRISFDQAPAMQAAAITSCAIEALTSPMPPDLLRLNWPNGDMVGHTGQLAATVAAIEAVDTEVGRLVATIRRSGAVLVLTADHGNADDMWLRDSSGRPQLGPDGRPLPRTSHTLAPVRCTILDCRPGPQRWRLRDDLPDAGLAHVAATVFELLALEPPDHMAPSLLAWR